MKIIFDKSFHKSLDQKLPRHIARQLNVVIDDLEAANDIYQIAGVKKLSGFKIITGYDLGITGWGLNLKINIPLE
jgi:hypothetical protein